jgi:membrane-associated phospholipid phosphatase
MDYLELLSSTERANIFDFELISRIGFAATPSKNGKPVGMKVLHMFEGKGSGSGVPDIQYHPLVEFIRPTRKVFVGQLTYLDTYSELRPDRTSEIIAQLGVPEAFFSSIAFFNAARMPRTVELIYAGLRLAYTVEMRLKHALYCRRPHEYSPRVQPLIPSPLHGSLPSGHATEAFIFARILSELLSERKDMAPDYEAWCLQLIRQASRIAVNRTVAGVHFPVDSVAGCLLGFTLADYFIGLGRDASSSTYQSVLFKGPEYRGSEDFHWKHYFDIEKQKLRIDAYAAKHAILSKNNKYGTKSGSINWLWTEARKEWNSMGSSCPEPANP